MPRNHSVLSEGTDVGLIGGVTIAAFFLILDLIAGFPFRTPSVLGQVLLFGNATPELNARVPYAIAAYTVFHFVVFVLLGIGLVKVVHLATDNSVVRFALLPIFLAFEVFFYGLLALFSERTRELFPLWTVLVANTLAVLAMGAYLWIRHPAFRQALIRTPLGAPSENE